MAATAPLALASPHDAALQDFLSKQLHVEHHQTATFDLNGDGRPETLVYADGPDDCGSGGCDLYVLTPDHGTWRVATDVSVTRLPIKVLRSANHGWHDLAVYVAGGGILPGHPVRLRFDGHSYPTNPTVPPAQAWTGHGGRTVMRSASQDR